MLKKVGSIFNYGKNVPDDMLELLILAKKNLIGIEIDFHTHYAAEKEPQVEKLIGFFPSGKFQILFKRGKKIISCIRGFSSNGMYEIYCIEGFSGRGSPERFEDPKDVIKRVRKLLNESSRLPSGSQN